MPHAIVATRRPTRVSAIVGRSDRHVGVALREVQSLVRQHDVEAHVG
jgi:hypothetical protein